MIRRRFLGYAGGLAAGMARLAAADEKLAGIACRSVHLAYPTGPASAFFNEVTVDRSAPGTYFCAIGWNAGYFGIQEQGRGRKVAIFSVWDSKQDDRDAVPESERVRVVHRDDAVRTGRFGNEGSGGQSFLDLDWKPGAPYQFAVTARPDGDRTEYAGFLREPRADGWRHLITLSTIIPRKDFGGFYSFVEDFRRDKVSATLAREAHFGRPWVHPVSGDAAWAPVGKARFTGDSNPAVNINARADGERFVLATGGETKNADARLNSTITLAGGEGLKPPAGLPWHPSPA